MNEQMVKPVFKGEVLLCEDNSMNQELICSRLSKMGLTSISAENGKEGVEKIKCRLQNGEKLFDLIFMDIYMPVMGGLEAALEIGKLNTGIPIIAMTANSNPAEREHYAAHGMSDCLNKPFTSQELLDCLVKYLKPENPNVKNHADILSDDMLDDDNLKIKLINNFVRQNKNFYRTMSGAIDDGDIKTAHRLAHTLKGSAGLLEKKSLQKAAGDAESLLKNEENRLTQPVMAALKTELDAVLAEFAPLIADILPDENLTAETKTATTVDSEQIRALFAELETMLDGGDVRCLDLTGKLRLIPGTGEPLVNGPLVRELIQHIEYFEFGRAMETLSQLKKGGCYVD